MRCCPYCHRPFPGELQVTGPKRQHLVDTLLRFPDGLTSRELMDRLYAYDPDGGPESTNIISVFASQANKELRKLGYEITAGLGPGARYVIRPTGVSDDYVPFRGVRGRVPRRPSRRAGDRARDQVGAG